MHKLVWSMVALFAASVAFAQSAGDAKVTLKRLIEKREISYEKGPFSGWENGIELTLHVDGPGVKDARKYGKLKATRAVDDVGTDLTKAGEGPRAGGDQMHEVREPQQFGFDDENKPKPTGFDVELELPTPPARSAKSITVVGSLDVLAGGEKKIVTVKPIKTSLGKAVEDPALKSLGVTFTLIDPSKPGAPAAGGIIGSVARGRNSDRNVTAQISGKIDAIASVEIVDAAGEKLNQGSMWSDDGGVRTITYDLAKPLADDMSLQLEIWPGQKTITVPFELRDVKLP